MGEARPIVNRFQFDRRKILKEVVENLSEDFIPIKNPAVDLQSSEILSVMKVARQQKQEVNLTQYSSRDRQKEALARDHLRPAELFVDHTAERDDVLAEKPERRIRESMQVALTQGTTVVDIGNVYERKVSRSDLLQWISDHKTIGPEKLTALYKACDLYIVYHVLYCDKMVVTKDGGNPVAVRIAGLQPIAFKMKRLEVRDGKLVLGEQCE